MERLDGVWAARKQTWGVGVAMQNHKQFEGLMDAAKEAQGEAMALATHRAEERAKGNGKTNVGDTKSS